MDEYEFNFKNIRPGTWLIEGDGCSSWVVAGDIQAVMIDTGYGVYNVRSYAEKITGRSIPWALNTHGHFDHTGGNLFFEKAYLTAEADKIARIPYPSFKGYTFNFNYESVIIGDRFIMDLGNRTLEALFIPAHDSGSIAFLDKKERLLFTGDEVGRNVPLMWQRPDVQPTVEQYMNNMEKLMSRRKEYDFICTGHGEDLIDASYVDKCLACAKQILAGFDGEPLSERDIGPPPPKPGDDPRKKKGPRPGDLIIYDIEFKRIAEYDSVKLMYDIRYKFNSKQG